MPNYEFDEEGRIVIEHDKSVKLEPYQARSNIPYTLATDQEIMDGAGGVLVADTETYKNYFLAAFRDIKTDKVIEFECNEITGERFNERKLSWLIHNYRVVTFNGVKYDMPLLWLAYVNQNPEVLKRASDDLIIRNVWHQELQKEYNFTIFPTNHVDLIEVCPLRGSLKLYAARLHAKRIQDLPISPHAALDEDLIDIVKNYCISGDLPATKLLYENLTEQLTLRENLSREYGQDLMSKSDAQIAEAVIGSELRKITGTYPKKPKIQSADIHKFVAPQNMFFQTEHMQKILTTIQNADFSVNENGRLISPPEIANLKIKLGNNVYRLGIGGLHSSEENTSIKSSEEGKLKDRDVASYYPRIVLNLGLYPKHIGEPFLLVYNGLVIRRLTAKQAKRIAESENLKVTINGTFGKTGSPYSILYAPEMTIYITVGGQLYLLMFIEAMELNGIPVYSANTDGIVIFVPTGKEETYLSIVKMWEQITHFETEETEYSAVYSRDVNAYMAIKPNGEIKGKNTYYDPWRGKSAKDQYWRFQKNPTAQICVEAIEKLLTDKTPIENTIGECTDITKFVCVKNVKGGAHKDRQYLGKVVRWAYFTGELGTINYITNDHKVPDTDGARPLMDLPDSFPEGINYDWYVERTKEMLMDMNYIKRPKQIKFF